MLVVGVWGLGGTRVVFVLFVFYFCLLFYFILFFAVFCVFSLCCLGGLVLGLVDLVALVTCFEGRFVVGSIWDGSWPCLFRVDAKVGNALWIICILENSCSY